MKINKVGTPLTIVAIFAGLAEVAGAAVLPLLEFELQRIFIWYVMLFPLILLSSFFITWNFNTKVLYPPSEFKDEKNYLNLLRIEGQEEIFSLQSKNLDDLKKQLIEVKESINDITSAEDNKYLVNSGKVETKTEEVDIKNELAERSKKTNIEVQGISKKINEVLQNVEEAQTYQKMVSKVITPRNIAMAKFVISQANGKCELCKLETNIIKTNGSPFLEAHHIIPLSEGGQDIYENIVALCPNCHKRIHFSSEPAKVQNEFQRILRQRKDSA